MSRSVVAFICALAALAVLCGAVCGAAGKEYKLEYKFYTGQRDKYTISAEGKMTLALEGNEPTEGSAKIELQVTRYVRKVSDEGEITFAALASAGEAEVMGSVREFERQRGPIITIEPTGKVVKVEPDEAAPMGFDLTRLKDILDYPVVLPSEEIEVGESWETESASGLKITNTLAKIESVDEVECAVIETKVSGAIHDAPASVPAPEGPVKLDVTVSNETTGRYELETGRLVDSEGVINIEAKGTQEDDGTPFELKMTLEVAVAPTEPNPLAPDARPAVQRERPKQGPASIGKDDLKKKD